MKKTIVLTILCPLFTLIPAGHTRADDAIRKQILKLFPQADTNKDGSISDIQVARGIGGGCDEEAIRVLTNSPKWNPGEQRGRAVKSRMSIQIVFTLK